MNSEKQLENEIISLAEAKKTLTKGMASVDEVVQIFKVVFETIKSINDTIDRNTRNNKVEMDDLFSGTVSELKKIETRMSNMSDRLEGKMAVNISVVQKQLLTEVNSLRELIPTLPDLTYLEEKIDAVKGMIPKIPEEIKAEKIRDKLETLKKDERLDASAIKGLDKDHAKLSDSIIQRAISIVDQRTSFLINKVSETATKVVHILANYIIGDGVHKITVSDTAPTNPAVGDLWVDTS